MTGCQLVPKIGRFIDRVLRVQDFDSYGAPSTFKANRMHETVKAFSLARFTFIKGSQVQTGFKSTGF